MDIKSTGIRAKRLSSPSKYPLLFTMNRAQNSPRTVIVIGIHTTEIIIVMLIL